MTTDQSAADAMRALARDLVEELAAGRMVVLANDFSVEPRDPGSDEELELASFNIRGFQRTERTKTGRTIVESVRPHAEQRLGGELEHPGGFGAGEAHYVAGAPGHEVAGNISQAKWTANEWKKRAQATQKVFSDIRDTRQQTHDVSVLSDANKHDAKHPASPLWRKYAPEADQHLAQAQRHVSAQAADQNKMDQTSLADAYGHLAQAHQAGVEKVLPRAQTPEEKKNVRAHLDRIQGHMEDLDKVVGTKPDTTRKITGTAAQQQERADKVRSDAHDAVTDAAEKGDHLAVRQAAEQHEGLVEPGDVKAAHERTGQVLNDKQAQQLRQQHGLAVGDQVEFPKKFDPQNRHMAPFMAGKGGQVVGVDQHTGHPLVDMPGEGVISVDPELLKSVQPDYPRGASAVYPNVGVHARSVMPGGTFSSHENVGRISPMQAVQQPQSPAEAELTQLKAQVAKFTQRDTQRRDADLREHLADLKASQDAYRGVVPEGTYRPLTDEEFAAHKDFVSSQVEKALRAGLATDQQYSLDGKGQVWSPERATLHAEILKDYLDRQVDVPSEKQALFTGGLPGAGKSSTLKDHPEIDLSQYATVNPDDFKEDLMRRGAAPEVPGLAPLETAALVHEESAYLADLVAHELERRGKNVAWDVTMKNHDITADRIRQLKRKGYRVHSLFVDVPVEKSADRVEARYRRGLETYRKGSDPLGGRFVPRSVVLAGELPGGRSRARDTFDRLRPEFASWELRNGEQHPASLVEKSAPASDAIMSAEALRRLGTGSSEQEARAAETGQAAREEAGLTQANPGVILNTEESESR